MTSSEPVVQRPRKSAQFWRRKGFGWRFRIGRRVALAVLWTIVRISIRVRNERTGTEYFVFQVTFKRPPGYRYIGGIRGH